MKLAQTERGIARLDGETVAFLDIEQSLDHIIKTGTLSELARAPVRETTTLAEADAHGIWLPPTQPERFVIAGLNYRTHCEEIGRAVPDRLLFGFAPGTAAHASGRPVIMPAHADTEIDYEGEIGIVIATHAENVPASEAWTHIAGIVPLNDVSARDIQAGGTMEALARAKGAPTFKPMGPFLATPDEYDDRDAITISTEVNGEPRQASHSGDMVFPIAEIVAVVTRAQPLRAGDVICTGTPGGVAHGGAHPYLTSGDRVAITVGGLPALVNTFQRA